MWCKKISIKEEPEKLRKFSFQSMFIIDKLLQRWATKYNKSIQWVHYKIKGISSYCQRYIIQEQLNLICDATFYEVRER